jgi:hypothetical protein
MSVLLRVLLSAFALGAPLLLAPGAAAQPMLVADGGNTAVGLGNQAGRVITFICPSTATALGQVWGSDIYSLDSAVCSAAVHAGKHALGKTSRVTIRIGGAANPLQGSKRNGVVSEDSPRADITYSFVENTETAQIDWNTTFARAPDGLDPLTLRCPPNGGVLVSVIGSVVYRSDSGICLAGVHAGIITLAEGGLVTVTFQPRRQTLAATTENGVESNSWNDTSYGDWPQPYSVAAVTIKTPEPPLAIPEKRGRMVTLEGFTAVGDAPLVVPRQITLTGFVAVGLAPEIVSRRVPLVGWTGTGAQRN